MSNVKENGKLKRIFVGKILTLNRALFGLFLFVCLGINGLFSKLYSIGDAHNH